MLADDHASFRQGLRSLLDSYADIEVVGEAENGEEVVHSMPYVRPTVIVMDINMPKLNGIEATRTIKGQLSTCGDRRVIGSTPLTYPIFC
jgi:DNA-binding NarL/FixJ family response regulator